jgi:hypothetical protein
MSEPEQIEDEEIELVPVPMRPETRAALRRFAERIGEPPGIAAGMLFEDLLEDEDFWEAFEDSTEVEPQTLN